MLEISVLDWLVIALYLFALIGFAFYLSRQQFNREDYYVGGRNIGRWPIAISILATQCSTNSILGAPAFVAFTAGGGLVWLQYELALPLAMLPLIFFLVPLFRRLQLVSVYEYLERRFDVKTRVLMSGIFLFVRAFATAVTVYSIAIVIDLITGIGFFWSVVLLGLFTVVYDVMGGIRGVIYSDVIQMLILVVVLLLIMAYLLIDLGGFDAMMQQIPEERIRPLDFSHHGIGDGHSFAFWPMLLGGFFLYVSYYGCDQSQVQRTLTAKSVQEGNSALIINGFLRFPLVALYCFVGIGLAVYTIEHASLINTLPVSHGEPNYNLIVPAYMIERLPDGVVGLGLVALFAAAMSSLDSVLNALSATTMEDFVRRYRESKQRTPLGLTQELWLSRAITAVWGVITLTAAFYVGDIAPTVLEAINKIGSLINGPILAVFALGVFSRRCESVGAVAGLLMGFCSNVVLWIFAPEVSWLWWNVSGFAVAVFVGMLVGATRLCHQYSKPLDEALHPQISKAWLRSCLGQQYNQKALIAMVTWFVFLLVVLWGLQHYPR
ncbi:Sodium/glucose cotransporter [Thalassocella blandensis]|nr:Sodium/glucose cotransporter [Thalassocella blandensis]